MSHIKLSRKHCLSLGDAKVIAQKAADDLAEKYDLQSSWEGDTLHFSRSGVDGLMHVTTQKIDLDVKLGLLLRPFKVAFEQNIEKNLDKLLAAPAAKTRPRAATGAAKPAGKAGARKA